MVYIATSLRPFHKACGHAADPDPHIPSFELQWNPEHLILLVSAVYAAVVIGEQRAGHQLTPQSPVLFDPIQLGLKDAVPSTIHSKVIQ
jgi:hypothetical protein